MRSGAGRENPNLTIGSSSSIIEVKMSDFRTDLPMDTKKAIHNLKDNAELYCMILNRFRNSLITEICNISVNLNLQNWNKLKTHAQSLKASAGTVGAGPIHYDCYFI